MSNMIINPFILGPPPFISDPLGTIIASCVVDLDATIAASYGGSGQIWANYEPSPSDGAGQTDYDFFLGNDSGSSTDDPTFIGSAGDTAAYWDHDGGDFFTSTDGTGAPNAITFRDMHKKASTWWVVIGFQTAGTLDSQAWFGSANNSSFHGMRFIRSGNVSPFLQQFNGSTQQGVNFGALLSTSTDYLMIISTDMNSTSNNVRIWLNTTTKTESSLTWKTETTNTDGKFRISAEDSGGGASATNAAENGTRLYSFAMGDAFINDSDASAIFTHLETRHNRDYTP